MITTLIVSLVLSAPVIDIKVDGEGYLRFAREGRIVYAKSAKLTVSQGKLAAITGEPVMPTMVVPDDTVSFEIGLDGAVLAVSKSNSKFQAGQFVLGYFENANQVHTDGAFLVSTTRPQLMTPGDGLAGVLRVGSGTTKTMTPPKADPKPAPIESTKTIVKPKTIETVKSVVKTTTPQAKNLAPGSVMIEVKPESSITAATYTVGDIAEVTADSEMASKIMAIPLGTSPLIGVKCPIDRYRLMSKIRTAGFEPVKWVVNVPTGAVVMHQAQKVTQEKFIECAVNYGKAQIPTGLSFTCSGVEREFLAPEGALELKCERFTMGTNSAMATIAVFVDGRRINSRALKLDITGSNGEAVVRVPGGARVKIVFRSNGAVVEVQGRTNTSALIGQTVQVTSDNRTNHTGILISPGIVEVKL